jgi:hypothetical protein
MIDVTIDKWILIFDLPNRVASTRELIIIVDGL